MADMLATMGLDDAEFKRGMNALLGSSNRTAAAMERSWGRVGQQVNRLMRFQIVGAAIQRSMMLARRGVDAYARSSEEGRKEVERLHQASDKLAARIGENLVPGLKDVVGWVAKLQSVLEKAGDGLLTIFLGAEEVAARNKALAEQRELDRQKTEDKLFSEEFMGAAAASAAALRTPGGDRASRMTEELARRQRERERIGGLALGPERRQMLQRMNDERHERTMNAIREEARAEEQADREKTEREWEQFYQQLSREEQEKRAARERHGDTLDGIREANAQRAVMVQRLRGEKGVADQMALQLDMRREIAAIEANEALSSVEKAKAIEDVSESFQRLSAAEAAAAGRSAGAATRVTVGLQAGMGRFARQVFGPGAAQNDHARRQTSLLQEVNKHLQVIAQNTAASGAVYD